METKIFYHFLFFILTFSCVFMLKPTYNRHFMFTLSKGSSFMLLMAVVFLLGVLPIVEMYSDRFLYAMSVENASLTENAWTWKDPIFSLYVKITGSFMSPSTWMYFTAFIYTMNHFIFSAKVGKYYLFPLFLMFITGFMFYSYGTNTIRAGFAASFLLLSFAYYEKLWAFMLFILIAVNSHFSMVIPAIAIVVSRFYPNTKLFFVLWLLSIPLSAMMGHRFEEFFSSLSSDSRTSYLTVMSEETHYKVGFRIDFILYSCVPIFMGFYYIVKRGIKDTFYFILYNSYLLANCFWILVIRANFSDRFAYLSWFIYPAVLLFPAIKYQLWKNQNQKVALIVFLHGLFTYIMFLK